MPKKANCSRNKTDKMGHLSALAGLDINGGKRGQAGSKSGFFIR